MKRYQYIILLLGFLGASFAAEQPKNILYLNSYHTGFQWSDDIEKGFTNTIALEFPNANIYFERMDTKRFPLDKVIDNLERSLTTKYQEMPIDIIVTSDDNAFDFSLKIRDRYFPGTPIVFSGVNNAKNVELNQNRNLTGVLESLDIIGLINLIYYVHPNVGHIAIIGDTTDTSQIHSSSTIEILKNNFSELSYSLHTDWVVETLESQLSLLPENTIIIEIAFHRDQLGNIMSLATEQYFLANQTNFPAYSLWSNRINSGVLGGVMNSGDIHGQEAGKLTTKVLSGTTTNELNVIEKIPFPIYFDYGQMKRFGISTHKLPSDAEILNIPDTFWFRYKRYLVAATMFVLLQSGMIIFLVVNVLKRVSAQRSLNELNSELESRIQKRTEDLSHSIITLEKTQSKLVEAQKMAALGGLVSGIAHKLNTPIGVCLTATSILKQELEKYEDVELETLSILEFNLNTLAAYNQDIKQMHIDSRTEMLESLNIESLINEFIDCRRTELTLANTILQFDCEKSLIVTTYPNSLLKVLSIFIQNTLLHGFKKDQDSKLIAITISSGELDWTLTYHDNGQGISATNRTRVFEPFFTTKFGIGNSGLGLNIAYNEVVHRFKGRIVFDDSSQSGLTIKLILPKKLESEPDI